MQHEHEAGTCSKPMQHGHTAWTCSLGMDMEHIKSQRTCSMNKHHGKAAAMCSRYMQQGHAACTCIHLSQDPCFFSLPSGSRLWNRVSSVVRQREEKARIRDFIFRARRFCFFSCSLFSALLHSFCFVLASESREKKRGRPPLYNSHIH